MPKHRTIKASSIAKHGWIFAEIKKSKRIIKSFRTPLMDNAAKYTYYPALRCGAETISPSVVTQNWKTQVLISIEESGEKTIAAAARDTSQMKLY